MMANKKPVSFIIPAYNCANTIHETVTSIFNENYEEGDEIILVDDCSTDNTQEVLFEIKQKYTSIKIIKHKVNKGTAAASRNTGIENSVNELIFCLDSDNVLAPHSISALKEHLIKQQADAAAFGELWFFLEDINRITHKWVFREVITLSDALAGPYWPGPSGNYLFTRSSWQTAGRYFEPTIENQTLDSWTFGIRQLGFGQKMVTLPETGYFHRYGHQSHYVRNVKKGNVSLSALIGIIPFLDQIEEADIDYVFSKTGRLTWIDKLNEKPIHVKNHLPGKTGYVKELLPHIKQNKINTQKNILSSIKSFLRRVVK